jgi:hypothetical protein
MISSALEVILVDVELMHCRVMIESEADIKMIMLLLVSLLQYCETAVTV